MTNCAKVASIVTRRFIFVIPAANFVKLTKMLRDLGLCLQPLHAREQRNELELFQIERLWRSVPDSIEKASRWWVKQKMEILKKIL